MDRWKHRFSDECKYRPVFWQSRIRTCISIAVAGKHQIQDAGAKDDSSGRSYLQQYRFQIRFPQRARSITRGLVLHGPNASFAKSKVECDTLILDKQSRSDTIPTNISKYDVADQRDGDTIWIEPFRAKAFPILRDLMVDRTALDKIIDEATVSNISEEQLFYLMSRGLSRSAATEMIVMGFLEPFTRELPMEYAVELNQLLKLDMSDSIG